MKKRIFSTLLLWSLILMLTAIGGTPVAAGLVVMATALTQWEFYTILRQKNIPVSPLMGTALGLLISVGAYSFSKQIGNGELLAATIVLLSFYLIYRQRKSDDIRFFLPTLSGIVLIAFPFSFLQNFLALYPDGFNGILLVFWVVAVAKFTDVGALLIGMKFGRTRFAEDISPKKSWEGVFGGLLTASALGYAISSIASLYIEDFPSGLIMIPVAILVGAAGITADLLESAFKRRMGIKDSGNLIPGIGGFCDLTDSLILAAPLGWLLFKLWMR
jgi:phosphatidate cytidylyltransferase